MKLHVGAGSIYLREWVNVDLPLPHVFLAKERMDLVEKFITTESNYYGRHAEKSKDTFRNGALDQDTVCDVFGSFAFLPARDGTVSEILSRQCFEHLHKDEARQAMKEARRVLKSGGLLRLDIPDPDETLRQYRQTGDEFFIRHLFGPRRDEWGYHTHYSRATLRQLASEAGFHFEQEEINPHCYPAFTMRFAAIK